MLNKKGDENTGLYTIFILIAVFVLLALLIWIIKTKVVKGIFGGL